jgi:hypothetical protein
MKNNLFRKLIVCLLTLVLLSLSAHSIAKDLSSPPYELLQSKTGKEKLDILARWEEADSLTRESVTAYFECKRDLANLNKRLDSAKAEKELKELQRDKARDDLKKLLLKAAHRIIGGAFVISADAAADLYLAGRAVKQAIKGSITSTDGEQVKVQEKDAAEAQRLVSEASKRQQAVASLEKAFVEAEQKVKAAEANRAQVVSRTPPKEQVASLPAAPEVPKRDFKTQGILKEKAEFDRAMGVTQYNPVERQKYLVSVKDGKIYDSSGKLLDTTHVVGSHGTTGRAIYVMDKKGNIYIHTEPQLGVIHHSSLVAGGEVAAAGEIRIEGGKLVYIDRNSGHYLLKPEFTDQVIQRLKDLGVDTSTIEVGHFGK